MYILKRTTNDSISYYKYDGWESFPKQGPLDLSGCVMFTIMEAANMVCVDRKLAFNESLQWYGSYKR